MSEVIIKLNGKEYNIQVGANEKILDATLKANVDAPYSCRSAICSACMAHLDEGEVDMEMNHVLTDGELDEGFIITCQSKPKSDRVVINYDF